MPTGYFTLNKISDVIKAFQIKKLEDYSSQYLGNRPLKIMRPEIRERMQNIRSLILEFESIRAHDNLIKQWTVQYAYQLGTATYDELQKTKLFKDIQSIPLQPNYTLT